MTEIIRWYAYGVRTIANAWSDYADLLDSWVAGYDGYETKIIGQQPS
jgi:hypothetical protein